MATVGTLIVKLQADISDFAKSMDTAMGKLQKSIDAAVPASKMLLGGVTALAGAFGTAGLAGIKMAGQMEQTKIAFTTMLGSAEKADKFIRGLWDFAAKTPFEFEGLAQSSRQLLAFGFQAEQIVPMMTSIGDAVSALGGGSFEIDRVTRALGQMQAKGKVSAEEMMQLAELGIPVWQMLADAIGVSIPEAMDMASKGGIDAATGINALLTGMTEQFGGSMEKQSQTLLGLWSTAKDNISGILRNLGQQIIETFDLKDKLAGAITTLQQLSDTLTQFFDLVSQKGLRQALEEMIPEDMQAKIVLIAGAIAGALVPAFISLAAGVWAAMAPLIPFMAAGAALAALAFTIYKAWEPISEFFRDTWKKVADIFNKTLDSIQKAVSDVWSKISQTTSKVWDGIKDFFSKWWPTLLLVFTGPLGYLVILIVQHWDKIKATTSQVWESIKGFLSGTWNNIKGLASSLWNAISGAISGPLQTLRNTITNIWSNIKSDLASIWNSLKSTASSIFSQIADAITRPFRNIHIPTPHFSFSTVQKTLAGITFPVPKVSVDWYATGGIFTAPQIIGVGERGPEAVLPLKENVFREIARGISANLVAAGGGGSAIIIQNMYVRSDQDIERVAQRLWQLQQSRSRGQGR